ncbi:type VI secretion system lipoprotein TssJ [Pusillimonas sp. MFBS29]|uniref:type VI secretion system lipoprotein TssJ n=1 Tax=Pusillimonas sp. MFBS29 TaxID=2886690 RepID=UPI001D12B06F|nr:type VI secretion system lipoprotein TssJ [Pusillimonas sp. MFBS29]MCC2596541.1 type VI secretion system lipoprotein TssJ [Pusillimonas sp. MFBS29]
MSRQAGRQRSITAFLFLMMGCAILAGCAATASRLAVPYVVELHAMPDVNPGANGEAAPIQLTVFELQSISKFQSTGYFDLQGDAHAALGDELLGVSRVMLRPGESKEITRSGDVNAKALGIVAGYRELDSSQWRLLVELPEARRTNIYKFWQFSPGEKRIRIDVGKRGMTLIEQD